MAKNRDAVIAILRYKSTKHIAYHIDNNRLTFGDFNWKDGLQTAITLITCTATNCCKDYGRRQIIQELLNENKLDFPLSEEFVALATCQDMKKVLIEWIQNIESPAKKAKFVST